MFKASFFSKSWRAITMTVSLSFFALPAQAATPPAKGPKLSPQSTIIAVGSAKIKKSQVDTLVNLMIKAREASGQGGSVDREQLERMVATNLIGQELLDLEAKKQNLVISPKEIDSAYMTFRGKFPSAQAFEAALQQTGEDEGALKRKIARQLKADKLLNARVGQMAPPTDQEVEAFFKENKKEFPISDSLRACQILLTAPKGTPASESNAKRDKLEAIRKELLADSASPYLLLRKFLMIASQIGDGPEKAAGGDLQRFKPSDFHPDFTKQIQHLKVGDLSPVFRTPLGWHLVVLTERNDGKLESYRLAIAQLIMGQKSMKSGQDLRKYLQDLAATYHVTYLAKSYKDTTAAGIYK